MCAPHPKADLGLLNGWWRWCAPSGALEQRGLFSHAEVLVNTKGERLPTAKKGRTRRTSGQELSLPHTDEMNLHMANALPLSIDGKFAVTSARQCVVINHKRSTWWIILYFLGQSGGDLWVHYSHKRVERISLFDAREKVIIENNSKWKAFK